jgi:hypothetical protein
MAIRDKSLRRQLLHLIKTPLKIINPPTTPTLKMMVMMPPRRFIPQRLPRNLDHLQQPLRHLGLHIPINRRRPQPRNSPLRASQNLRDRKRALRVLDHLADGNSLIGSASHIPLDGAVQ